MAATEGEMMESNRDMMAKAMIPTRIPRFRLVSIPVFLGLDAHGSGSTVAASLSISAAPFLVDGGSLLQQQGHANQHDEEEQIKSGIDFQVIAFLARILLDHSLVGNQ